MPIRKRFVSNFSFVVLIAIVGALFCAAPTLVRPDSASAQGVSCGGIFYPSGTTCGNTGNTGVIGTTCNGVYEPNLTSCPSSTGVSCNGIFYPSGTYCGNTGTPPITCSGVSVGIITSCPLSSYQTCPDGSLVPIGQACASSNFTCPNGTVIFSGQTCSATTFNCPDGTVITTGQTCPVVSGTQFCNGTFVGATFCGSGTTVNYPAGWNLVGGPTGTLLTSASGPLYTLQAGSTSYLTLPPGTPLQGTSGYWVYFPSPTTVTLATGSAVGSPVNLPPGPFVMIGNPSNTTVGVSGAGVVVLVYDPTTGSYTQTSQLNPGQGAWAASATGGQLNIGFGPGGIGTGPGGGPPPPPPPL